MSVQFCQGSDFPTLKTTLDQSAVILFTLLHVNTRNIHKCWNEFSVVANEVFSVIDVFVSTISFTFHV